LSSIQQDADAVKGMPLVRNYIHDPFKELVRPDCERNRQWFHVVNSRLARLIDYAPEGKQTLETEIYVMYGALEICLLVCRS
jgi:hypothetical protein